MNILLLDCSSKTAGYGFALDGELILERILPGSRNADTLMYEIRKDFSDSGLTFKDIEVVSLSNGPGSFTGLRIGSAIAKGICFALGAKFIEVVTLDIIAKKHRSASEYAAVVYSGMVSAEFYYALYKNDDKLVRTSGYNSDAIGAIIDQTKDIVINEKIDFRQNFKEVGYNVNNIDVSGTSGLREHLELTLERIDNNSYSDIGSSEPFYMKEFKPLIKEKS
jgi:tRNA threonylcarbamoyladenosine biosynthesis protein TsaB